MTKFTEERLEQAIITLLAEQGYPHHNATTLPREPHEALLTADLRAFLSQQYAAEHITPGEIDAVIRRLQSLPAADLYDSNKTLCTLVADGFLLKREDPTQKDLYIQLIDYQGLPGQQPRHPSAIAEAPHAYQHTTPTEAPDRNHYRLVNQLNIHGHETRTPDAVLYINGLPLVVFEFKSAIREQATLHDAYIQLSTRYTRDIPELMKYNALCIISDGVNTRMGSLFAPYDFFYTWRKITGSETIG